MILTSFEKNILRNRIITLLVWCEFVLLFIGFFYIHWVLGVFSMLCFTPIVVWFCLKVGQFYFPSEGYFHKYFFQHSREERAQFSEQTELLGKYPNVGELVGMDEYLVFKKFGIVLPYRDIKNISYERYYGFRATPKDSYKIIVETVHSKFYHTIIFNNRTPFTSQDGAYFKLAKWVRQKFDEDTVGAVNIGKTSEVGRN